jgi:hypothetical protein
MAQGIIKHVTPQMQGNVHRTWINKFTGKINYGFMIEFEDGVQGNCGSEKNTYPIPSGTQVTYDCSTMTNGTNHITKVKKVELVESNGKSYSDPNTIKRIAFSMCQTIARLHFANAGIPPRSLEEVNMLARVYNDWVLNGIQESDIHFRDLVSRRYYALQLAVECIPFSSLGILKKEQVIASAETFLKPLTDIGHASQI